MESWTRAKNWPQTVVCSPSWGRLRPKVAERGGIQTPMGISTKHQNPPKKISSFLFQNHPKRPRSQQNPRRPWRWARRGSSAPPRGHGAQPQSPWAPRESLGAPASRSWSKNHGRYPHSIPNMSINLGYSGDIFLYTSILHDIHHGM